jgi:hypothetical protein
MPVELAARVVPWQFGCMNAPTSKRPSRSDRPARRKEDEGKEEAMSALDELVQTALAYHTPERLRELLDFAERLPKVAPFNAMLLHVQNPSMSFACSAREWAMQGRRVKLGSRPMVIMKLMGPVSFVFDLVDTEGAPLPPAVQAQILHPFSVEGTVTEQDWAVFVEGCRAMDIGVEEKAMGPDAAGQMTRLNNPNSAIRYQALVNDSLSLAAKYVTLAHELAHLFCGHLGADKTEFWENRSTLSLASREMEAEAVANLVGRRRRLMAASAKYLSGYLSPGQGLPDYSLEVILKVVHSVEEVAQGKVPSRERNRRRKVANDRRKQEQQKAKAANGRGTEPKDLPPSKPTPPPHSVVPVSETAGALGQQVFEGLF